AGGGGDGASIADEYRPGVSDARDQRAGWILPQRRLCRAASGLGAGRRRAIVSIEAQLRGALSCEHQGIARPYGDPGIGPPLLGVDADDLPSGRRRPESCTIPPRAAAAEQFGPAEHAVSVAIEAIERGG